MKRQEKNAPPTPIESLEIICVGTELLLGDTVNTNAAYLARRLAQTGIPCYYQSVTGDHVGRLVEALRLACSRSEGVILTGGLGPTSDDITVEAVAKYVGIGLKEHPESRSRIEQYFQSRHLMLPTSNFKQALVPEGGVVFNNEKGTAPGGLLEANGKILIWLPGPPSEMEAMFESSVQPFLSARAPMHLESVYIRLIGIGESAAEAKIKDLIDAQTNPTVAPYCSTGECMFRVTYSSRNFSCESEGREELDYLVQTIAERLGDYVYEIGKRSLPEVVSDLLRKQAKTVSFAESCTAGLLTSMIGQHPGASDVLSGSVVAYSNASKETLLGIPSELMRLYGAVSRECAMAMADRCRKTFGSDLAVSVTGIAGPGGGSPDKPVGTVFIGFSRKDKLFARCMQIRGDRTRIRYVASLEALNIIRKELIDEG